MNATMTFSQPERPAEALACTPPKRLGLAPAGYSGWMRVVCAWCQSDMGTKTCEPAMDGAVSHGICRSCFVRMTKTQ